MLYSNSIDRAKRVAELAAKPIATCLKRGIEKEGLRLEESGLLSQKPHPRELGSTLTNSFITTDYSEALLEFITPVHDTPQSVLNSLDEIHRFSYDHLGDELLWTASMPCILPGDANIPIARYGKSNIGKLKEVYREGLGHRYGRLMQTIAGIHYNFSVDHTFWQAFMQEEGYHGDQQAFISEKYLGLVRNFRRYSWLLIYLFGASPAVCKSFLGDRPHHLETIVEGTLGVPFGTSLRMGNLGYQSSTQESLAICYNDLNRYCQNLQDAIRQSVPEYEAIGTKSNGEFKQLNTSILQIENEYYSTVRPKRTTKSGETPSAALMRGGIEYIEVRCIDINPYLPLGIDNEQIHFIDLFLLYCLLNDSPQCDAKEYGCFSQNRSIVVNEGRKPGIKLIDSLRDYKEISLHDWAMEMIHEIADIADQLGLNNDIYRRSIAAQKSKVIDPECTPSARILSDIVKHNSSYFKFAMDLAIAHADDFKSRPLSSERKAFFEEHAKQSLDNQVALEANQNESFESFWKRYFKENYNLTVE